MVEDKEKKSVKIAFNTEEVLFVEAVGAEDKHVFNLHPNIIADEKEQQKLKEKIDQAHSIKHAHDFVKKLEKDF